MNKCMKKIRLDMNNRSHLLINRVTSSWKMDQKVAITQPILKRELKKLKPKKKKLLLRKKKKRRKRAKSSENYLEICCQKI
jgi:hypothetical protein